MRDEILPTTLKDKVALNLSSQKKAGVHKLCRVSYLTVSVLLFYCFSIVLLDYNQQGHCVSTCYFSIIRLGLYSVPLGEIAL